MDQPINLPSQFISLRWRCVEIHRSKISLFGSRIHAKRPIPLYRRESLRLSINKKNYFPSDPFHQPMLNKRADANQKATKSKAKKSHKNKHMTHDPLLCLRSRQGNNMRIRKRRK